MLCLFGCATQKVTTYSYCLVDDVKKDVIDDLSRWIVHCDGGGTVIFPRQVGIGEGVYFSPYYENEDPVTEYGYIKQIDEVVK
jgi:hypothetical protein